MSLLVLISFSRFFFLFDFPNSAPTWDASHHVCSECVSCMMFAIVLNSHFIQFYLNRSECTSTYMWMSSSANVHCQRGREWDGDEQIENCNAKQICSMRWNGRLVYVFGIEGHISDDHIQSNDSISFIGKQIAIDPQSKNNNCENLVFIKMSALLFHCLLSLLSESRNKYIFYIICWMLNVQCYISHVRNGMK